MRSQMICLITLFLIIPSQLGCLHPETPKADSSPPSSASARKLETLEARDWPDWFKQATQEEAQLDAEGRVRLWQKMVADHEDSEVAWANLAQALGAKADYEGAIHAADRALEVNPHYGGAYDIKVRTLVELDKIPEALEAAKRGSLAVAIKGPFGEKSQWQLSRWLFALSARCDDDYASVLEVADKIEENEGVAAWLAYPLRAGAHWRRGELALAEKTARAGMEVPNYRGFRSHPDLELILALVRLYEGQSDVAQPFREHIGQRMIFSPVGWLTIAADAAKKGQWRECVLYLEAYYFTQGPEGAERYVCFPLFPAEDVLWQSLKTLAASENKKANAAKFIVLGLAEKSFGNSAEATAAFKAARRVESDNALAQALVKGATGRDLFEINRTEVLAAMKEAVPSM